MRRTGNISKLDVLGESQRSYALQTSTDLKTWSNSLSFSNSTGFVHLEIPGSGAAGFYRALLIP